MIAAARLLLAHDLRLAWRGFRGGFRRLGNGALLALVAVVGAGAHAAAWAAARPGLDLAPGTAFVMLLMTAQVLNAATRLVYERGDLELILSAPFPARVVLVVRGLALAGAGAGAAAVFVVPLADVGLLRGDWRALALVPALAAGALVATAVSLTATLALLLVAGPRRTRALAQVVATLVGGGFVISLQLNRLLPGWRLPAVAWPAWLGRAAGLPVRAAGGDGPSLALWVALALALYGLVTLGLGGVFARGVVAATAVPRAASGRRSGARERRFAGSLGACLRGKELRLLRRDPWLLSQLLQQSLYMLPLLVGLWSGTGGNRALAVATTVTVLSYQVAAAMTWLSLSGEEAPDLLATAPVRLGALRLGKLTAVGEVVAALVILPLAWLATLSWRAGLGTAALAALAVCLAMVIGTWHARPVPRSRFAARHRESKLLTLVDAVMSALLGLAAALLAAGSAWALLPLAAAGLVLAVNRPRAARSGHQQAAAAREAGQQPAQVAGPQRHAARGGAAVDPFDVQEDGAAPAPQGGPQVVVDHEP